VGRRCTIGQDHGLKDALDNTLLEQARAAIEYGQKVELEMPIRNVHRTVGAMLSGEIARRYGARGLPEDTVCVRFNGSAGQSFGAFLASGVSLFLEGDSNDYVGKGLSGGKIVVFPPKNSGFPAEDNIVVGNTVLYGATSGEAYFSGVAGERFAVRNSGARAVVEGVGDHACEYMTNGVVVVLGKTGRNFGAGMSGGLAFVYDPDGEFARVLCNRAGVELEPLFEREDLALLENLVRNHVDYTGSPLGRRMLEHWGENIKYFVKVLPHEYKRILEKQRSAEKKGMASAVLPKEELAMGEAAR
jgi:glutamate synthase (NADPH) large chain